ncbi:MAG: nuclear transport factor 2 family protein [Porticoccaceae bacterium]|nr:nuclear transport factor 2 family protein [Porticoccaceae bacterium]
MANAAQVVRAMLDAVLRGDGEGAMACVHHEIVVIEPGSLPYGGVYQGMEEFRDKVYASILGKFTIAIGRCELLGTDEKVAASMDITFTSRKTGTKIAMPYVEIYTVRDGAICHLDVYPQDTKALLDFWNAN